MNPPLLLPAPHRPWTNPDRSKPPHGLTGETGRGAGQAFSPCRPCPFPAPTSVRRSQEGTITVAGMMLALVFLVMVSLVYWQGVQLRAARQAASLAEEAARAGAGQLDRDRTYIGAVPVLDRAAALAQARAYLAAAASGDTPGLSVSGQVTVSGPRTVTVTVTVTRPAPGLDLIGVTSIRATRSASAEMVTGLEGPDSP